MASPAGTPEAPSIRRAVSDDAATLSEFAASCFRDTFARDNSPANMDQYIAGSFGQDIQRAVIADPRGIVLLMESGEQLVGYAHVRDGAVPVEVMAPSPIELQRFYIAREWHGLGLAQLLMRAVVSAATERGARALWLAVWENNPRAISFYRKMDFVDVGSQEFMLGSDRQTDRVMCRSVTVSDRP
jgi:ribosomal protein S18 acetylase RimI-like enzyme